jgi:hypothetical protein
MFYKPINLVTVIDESLGLSMLYLILEYSINIFTCYTSRIICKLKLHVTATTQIFVDIFDQFNTESVSLSLFILVRHARMIRHRPM